MVRITPFLGGGEYVLKVEGHLAGPWVSELYGCWREAAARHDVQVLVDLTDVWHVDAAGRELLALMHRAGAAFRVRGCVMPELVREITDSANAE